MTYYQRLYLCLFWACIAGLIAMLIHSYAAYPAALVAFCVAYKLTDKLKEN